MTDGRFARYALSMSRWVQRFAALAALLLVVLLIAPPELACCAAPALASCSVGGAADCCEMAAMSAEARDCCEGPEVSDLPTSGDSAKASGFQLAVTLPGNPALGNHSAGPRPETGRPLSCPPRDLQALHSILLL